MAGYQDVADATLRLIQQKAPASNWVAVGNSNSRSDWSVLGNTSGLAVIITPAAFERQRETMSFTPTKSTRWAMDINVVVPYREDSTDHERLISIVDDIVNTIDGWPHLDTKFPYTFPITFTDVDIFDGNVATHDTIQPLFGGVEGNVVTAWMQAITLVVEEDRATAENLPGAGSISAGYMGHIDALLSLLRTKTPASARVTSANSNARGDWRYMNAGLPQSFVLNPAPAERRRITFGGGKEAMWDIEINIAARYTSDRDVHDVLIQATQDIIDTVDAWPQMVGTDGVNLPIEIVSGEEPSPLFGQDGSGPYFFNRSLVCRIFEDVAVSENE